MEYCLSIWLILVLVLTFTRIQWGVALFLAYMILVPVMHFSFMGYEFGVNLFNTVFLIGYLYHASQKHYKMDWKPLAPFILYFLMMLVIMFFQSEMPFGIMFNYWRLDIMKNLILPFVIWNLMVNDVSCINLFRKTLLISIFIAVGYGLFLTTTNGINPYIMSLMNLQNENQDMQSYYEGYYAAENGGRLFGRISSVFLHPMSYALFIGLSFVYIFQSRVKINKWLIITLIVALIISAITCGVRSVLGGLSVTIVYYFMKARNYKMMMIVVVAVIVGYYVIETIPELSAYMGSMTDLSNSHGAVKGSSVDMRISQLVGSIDLVSRNPIWGLGYGWTTYYMSLHEAHPVCLAFESLLFVIICNWGIAGFIVWGVMLFQFFRYNRNMSDTVLLGCLMLFYISYSCITGEYGYMKYFLLFYILMLGNRDERTVSKATLNI